MVYLAKRNENISVVRGRSERLWATAARDKFALRRARQPLLRLRVRRRGHPFCHDSFPVRIPGTGRFPHDAATSEPGQHMLKVTGFVQRNPDDGRPVSQRTEVILGYDNKNLYVVFVCFDDPRKVRARRARREDILADDNVEIMLDTFHDQRRSYAFQTNPLGVQWDAIWTESSRPDTTDHFDTTFDTLWYSQGKLTDQGYVVWMAIPFRSLRFAALPDQTWGIILYRGIIRENEDSFWPAISSKLEGRLDRAVTAKGMEGISPWP